MTTLHIPFHKLTAEQREERIKSGWKSTVSYIDDSGKIVYDHSFTKRHDVVAGQVLIGAKRYPMSVQNDFPSFSDSDGMTTWRKDGKFHRTTGPAKIYQDYELYYLDGDGLSKQEFLKNNKVQHRGTCYGKNKEGKQIEVDLFHEQMETFTTNEEGKEELRIRGEFVLTLHNTDKPTIVGGSHFWYKDGKTHNTVGPAYISNNGDRPKSNYYRINGKELTESEFIKHPECRAANIVRYIDDKGTQQVYCGNNMPTYSPYIKEYQIEVDGKYYIVGSLNDLPTVQSASHTEYLVSGKRHRVGGPALYDSGGEIWYSQGEIHRLDGPAIILQSGVSSYYILGRMLTKEQHGQVVEYSKTHFLTHEIVKDFIFIDTLPEPENLTAPTKTGKSVEVSGLAAVAVALLGSLIVGLTKKPNNRKKVVRKKQAQVVHQVV